MRHAAGVAAIVVLAGGGGAARADVVALFSGNPESGGNFGVSVSGIPDLNGDGVDDVIVGASGESPGGVDESGRVYIFSGASGALIRTHVSPNSESFGRFGIAVAGVRDFNGDGRGEYLVGAGGESSFNGRAYVYSGINGALVRTHNAPPGVLDGFYGERVAAIDDIFGDGLGDYAIASPFQTNGEGRVFVYAGVTGALLRFHASPNAEAGGNFGNAIAGVPDANGDGSSDYVVGAPQEDPGAAPSGAGRAYVFSGANGALLATLQSPLQEQGGNFGASVGGVPDASGDGLGDVVVGAPLEDVTVDGTEYANAGNAYLFAGNTGFFFMIFREPEEDIGTQHQFGGRVEGIADRTGDGLGEIVVAATGDDAAAVYVFEGGLPFDQIEVVHAPILGGADQLFGWSLARLDANADGRGDFVIGAPFGDGFPTKLDHEGRAWIHRSTLVNDGCGAFSILELFDGPNEVTTLGATGGGNEAGCLDLIESDVWFRYTATCSGQVIFSTCGASGFDTVMAVYQGCAFTGFPAFACQLSGNLLACVDNSLVCGLQASVAVDCVEGECFFVRLGGKNGAESALTLTVTCSCPGDANDDGVVDGGDITEVLGEWGPCVDCPADVNDDGTVDGADITVVLGHWGPC